MLTRPYDTAGQERFSCQSSAFFYGADTAILIFDVNRPETLRALDRRWSEFCACAPLSDDETAGNCLVVVENKINLVSKSEGRTVEATLDFIDEPVPPLGSPSSSPATPEEEEAWTPMYVSVHISVGSTPRVVVHDIGVLDSGASGPAGIILVDEAHYAIDHHIIPDADNDVGGGREDPAPTFTIPSRTPCSLASCPVAR